MILTCPTCGTRYQTDRARMAPPGGNVRCAKCLAVWFHSLAEEENTPELDPDEAPSSVFSSGAAVPEEPTKKSAPRDSRPLFALIAGWGALIVFLGAFVWAAIAYRHEVATVWPQSASFYAAINLPVNVRGLAFTGVALERETEEGVAVLRISGRVVNVAEGELPVPSIFVSLRDVEERELYGWTIDVGTVTLEPGESSPFVTRLPNPPLEMRRADLSFVAGAEQ